MNVQLGGSCEHSRGLGRYHMRQSVELSFPVRSRAIDLVRLGTLTASIEWERSHDGESLITTVANGALAMFSRNSVPDKL